MTNSFYNANGTPGTGAKGASAPMRAELLAVQAGFDKFPAFSGNALKLLRINAGATALEAYTLPAYAPLDGVGTSGTWPIGVTGNAATATKLATARTINGGSFDGSANVTIPAFAIDNSSNANFRVPFMSSGIGNANNFTNASFLYNPSTGVLSVGSITGNASTATKLATARSIDINGLTTTPASFDGSGNVAITVTGVPAALLTGTVTATSVAWSGVTGKPAAVTALSGTNTGDQTSVTGNAGTATALATARTINGASFNGTANVTVPVNAAASATNADFSVAFLSGATGNVDVKTDTGLQYNPSLNTLTVPEVVLAAQVATNDYSAGYKKVPRSASATITRLYAGFCKSLSAGVTIPSGEFEAGDSFSIFNNSASAFNVTQGSGLTMYGPGGTTGTKSLAARGMCTIWFDSASVCKIMGEVS